MGIEYFGLLFIGGAILYGVLTFKEPAKAVVKQIKRANDLKEAELQSRGIAVVHEETKV